MKLVKTPCWAATLKNRKQLHCEVMQRLVLPLFYHYLLMYIRVLVMAHLPLIYTRLALCQVSPTLLTTGPRYEALCCRSSILLSVSMYYNFSLQSKILWRQRNLKFDFLSVSFISYFPWKMFFFQSNFLPVPFLVHRFFVPTINFLWISQANLQSFAKVS